MSWRKVKKIVIVSIIAFIAVLILFAPSDSNQSPTKASVQVEGLSEGLIKTTENSYELKFVAKDLKNLERITINKNETSVLGLEMNGENYTANLSLQEGDNIIRIELFDIGKDNEVLQEFVIKYEPKPYVPLARPEEPNKEPEQSDADKAKRVLDNLFLEAEVSCQQTAEKKYNVEDINISYDQSSIQRQNDDKSLFIKVNIADSRGFLRAEKAIGVMECTTSADGLSVIKFISY